MSINETLVDFNLRNVVGDFLIVSSMDHLKKQGSIVFYWSLMSYKRIFPHTRRCFFKLNELKFPSFSFCCVVKNYRTQIRSFIFSSCFCFCF